MANIEDIVDYLILVTGQTTDVTLYRGKTGVILSLMMYSKCMDCNAVKEFCDECFSEIYTGIHDGMHVGIEYGLAGVGYGITLMKKAQLIDCDLNDVLLDIDSQIMNTDPRRYNDLSFRKGLSGVMAYINLRHKVEGVVTSFDPMYINELVNRLSTNSNISESEISKTLIEDIEAPDWKEDEFASNLIGIHQGCSYYLIKNVYDKVFYNK